MLQTRLHILRLSRGLRRLPQRRLESTYGAAPDAGHGPATAVAPAPAMESFSWSFYAFFVTIPIVYFIAQDVRGATPENPPYLTRIIKQWTDPNNAKWDRNNIQFMNLMEQAAFDRALFQHADKAANVEIRMPELMGAGAGAPYAVAPGDFADMSVAIEHYRRKNLEMDERVRNKTPEQIYAAGGDRPPAPSRNNEEQKP